MKREFDDIMQSLKKTIAGYDYYVDFNKVITNVELVEMQLNELNYLIGKDDFDDAFNKLLVRNKDIIKVLPILFAVRKGEIEVLDNGYICYNFNGDYNEPKEYLYLLEKSGLKDLIQNKRIKSLVDYVFGIEVGLDTNARKNRTGKMMELIVKTHIEKIPNVQYNEQMNRKAIKDIYGIDLLEKGIIGNNSFKANKRFDFVLKTSKKLYLIEVNYYSTNGSKLNETARSYSKLSEDIAAVEDVEFIWITDGKGWEGAKGNLKEAHGILKYLYTLQDLENNVLSELE